MSGKAQLKVRGQSVRPAPAAPSGNAGRRLAGSQKVAVFIMLVVVVFMGVGALLWQFIGLKRSGDQLPPVSTERAMIVARRVGVAFDDGQQTWSNWFRANGMQAPRPAEIVLFNNARPTPCSGTSPVGGPFYCPLDNKASFDLVLLNQLEKRMDREAGLGTALIVARVLSEHVQGALGVPTSVAAQDRGDFSRQRTLQADCLTGVWAGLARNRIGTVPPGFYSRLLSRGRLLMELYVNGGHPDQPALDIFLFDDYVAREEAFRLGLDSRNVSECPRPR